MPSSRRGLPDGVRIGKLPSQRVVYSATPPPAVPLCTLPPSIGNVAVGADRAIRNAPTEVP